MSLYSKQQFFCNCCGKEMFCTSNGVMGGQSLGWRVCSPACIREIRWRDTLSMLGQDYYPDPEPYKESV